MRQIVDRHVLIEKSPKIQLRNISYGELHLMFIRLAIDVKENPTKYESVKGINEFVRQENFRRNLFIK